MTGSPEAPAAVLRIVSGNPTAEEIAVVTAVISAAAAGTAPPGPADVLDQWTSKSRQLRTRPAPGPVTWRDQGLPRIW